MKRVVIEGNFLVLYEGATEVEFLRHPLGDTKYQIYDPEGTDPVIKFLGLSSEIMTRDSDEADFKLSELQKENGDSFTDLADLKGLLNPALGFKKGGGNGSGVASVTGFGVNNADPENPIIDDVLGPSVSQNTSDIGDNTTAIGNNTALANSKVASVSGYNVDNTDPTNPVIEDNYEIRNDDFTTTISNAWHQLAIPGAPANRIVCILIQIVSNNNNITVGIDTANGIFNRTARIDRDSTVSFTVKTNASGEVDIFTSNASATSFKVESYQN